MNDPSPEAKNAFYAAMQPRWDQVRILLAAERPPGWEGYRFEAHVSCDQPAVPGRFTIDVKFGDRVSNRLHGGVPRDIVDRLADLRMTYLRFSPWMTWSSVTIEQIRNPEERTWSFDTRFSY